jgi:hypothetical protein
VTVHTAPAGSGELGVNVNVVAPPGGLGASVNASGVPVGQDSVNALPVTFTGLLNVTDGVALASTPVAPSAGVVPDTVGGVSIVNEKLWSASSAVPVESVTCEATTVTVHVTPAGSGPDGASANVLAPPGGLGDSANASGVPAGHSSLNALAVTFTGLLNVTAGVIVAITLIAPVAGTVALTVGGVSTVNEKL